MPPRHRWHPVAALAVAAPLVLVAPASPVATVPPPAGTQALRQSFELVVPASPSPVPVAGALRLVYELHVTSFATEPLRITGLTVLDADRGGPVAELAEDGLAARLAPVGAPGGADALAVAPGARAVIYLEIDLPGAPVPSALVHRVAFAASGAAATVEGAPVPVRDGPLPALGPPLRGGPWAAVYHPSWPRGHRRVLYALDGRARIPGRFAIDWIRLDAGGRVADGDRDLVARWLGHRAPVLAVADAVVAAARDDVPESARLSAHPEHPLEDAAGNYVALDLGGGRYAWYEHLAPGSVRVTPGERVRRGQVIAALGFTGHSTGPHLHFHVADGVSPLGSEGMPFVLESFEVLGAYDDVAALGGGPWTPLGDRHAALRTRELPAPNAVVRFPEPEPDP